MKKKNILFLFPDQLRADFVGCYGAEFAKTPNIDKLACEGILYKRAVSPSPFCVPARASLLTGHNSLRNGVIYNTQWLRPDYETCGIETWPALLSMEGYETTAIGKMHFYPWDAMEGFNKRIIAEDKRHIFVKDDYSDYLETMGLKKIHGNEHEGYYENKGAVINKIPLEHTADEWIARNACQYIEHYDEPGPFALMVGFLSPHCPYDPPREYADLFDEAKMPDSIPATEESNSFRDDEIEANLGKWNGVDYSEFTEQQKKKIRAHYCATVSHVDNGIGAIIDSLKKKGLYNNTVIIFSSDHGDYLGDYDFVGKGHFYESSIHVPLIIKHPDITGHIQCDSLVSLTDIRAAILMFAGMEECITKDSRILPVFGGEERKEGIFGFDQRGYMLVEKRWKLCRYYNGVTMLFDLKNDPYEQINLAYDRKYSLVMKRMDAVLQAEIVSSACDANADKNVEHRSIKGRDLFYERNWERPYPSKWK